MDIIYENNLKELLSNGKILPVYLFFGDDGYLINHYKDIIINKTCGKDNDFDFHKFEKDIDLQEVFDALNQFPMMGERKCVILSDYDFESASSEEFDKLIILLSDTYEFSTLILVLEDIDVDFKHSSRAKKVVKAVNSSGGCVVNFKHRGMTELARMLINGAKKRDCTLDMDTAKYMIETCGSDINTLRSELDKICSFTVSGNIAKADIDIVCVKSVEASVYEFVKAIFNCNACLAFKILGDLLYMRFEPMIIVYTVASAFVDIVRTSAAKKSNKTIGDIVADFPYKNKEFTVERAYTNFKKIDDNKLKLCIKEILNVDNQLKSSSADKKFLLEQLTVKLIYIIANGDEVDKN